jgi:hypothetical protein
MARKPAHPHPIIDGLGGTSEVAKLTLVPISTVHSWRKIGIPRHRLHHLKLAAVAAEKPVPAELERAIESAAA